MKLSPLFTNILSIFLILTPALETTGSEINNVLQLQAEVDAAFVDTEMVKLTPPGGTYNETLPVITLGPSFPSTFLEQAEATTQHGVNRYQLSVSEADGPVHTRSWTSMNGLEIHSHNPPVSYDPHGWVLTHFPPPDHLDAEDLPAYVYERRPGRRTLQITLMDASDFAVWQQALADEAAALALNDPDPEVLEVGAVRPLPDSNGIELLTQVPAGIGIVGLWHKQNLLDPQWQQVSSIDVVTQPFWAQAYQTDDIGFYMVANHVLDSDGDGIIDALEDLIEGTDSTNPDTDGDGLSDGDELWIYGTSALLVDTDGDGLSDGFEIDNGRNPLDPNGNDGVPDGLADLDGDGVNGLLEYQRGTKDLDPDLSGEDTRDTDGDGKNDLVDAVGYDPFFTFRAAPETRYSMVVLSDPSSSPGNTFSVNNQGEVIFMEGGELKRWNQGTVTVISPGGHELHDHNNTGKLLYSNGDSLYLDDGGTSTLLEKEVTEASEEMTERYTYADEEHGRLILEEYSYQVEPIGLSDTGVVHLKKTSTYYLYDAWLSWLPGTPEPDSSNLNDPELTFNHVDQINASSRAFFEGGSEVTGTTTTHMSLDTASENGTRRDGIYREEKATLLSFAEAENPQPPETLFETLYVNHQGDWIRKFETEPDLTQAVQDTYPRYHFSDDTSVYGGSNPNSITPLQLARLPDQGNLWKLWQVDEEQVLTEQDPLQGGSFYHQDPETESLSIEKIAANGLVKTAQGIWRNGRLLTHEDLIGDDPQWANLQVEAISDNGTFLAGTAMQYALDAEGQPTDQELGRKTVLLLPLEIVRETEKGSGEYERLSAIPIYVPDDGVGRGVDSTEVPNSYTVSIVTNLSISDLDMLSVHFANMYGTYTGTLTETGVGTGVFESDDGTVTATLNPIVETSDSQIDVLCFTVTAPAVGLVNAIVTVQETDSDSKQFVQTTLDIEIELNGMPNPNQPDQITASIHSELTYEIGLVESGTNTNVFLDPLSDFTLSLIHLTTLSPSNKDIVQVTLTGAGLPSEVTYILEEIDDDALVFANFTTSETDITPDDPSESHNGVFFVRIAGRVDSASLPFIKIKVDDDTEVEVPMCEDPTDSRYMISEPLLLLDESATASYSGLTTLTASSGAATSLAFSFFGAKVEEKESVFPAFLGFALEGKDFDALTGDHLENLDRILGRKSGFGPFSTPPKLGYGKSTIDKKVKVADLHKALPKHSIFYIMAHGVANNELRPEDVKFKGITIYGTRKRDHLVTAQEISDNIGENEYNLVFLNACGAANDSLGRASDYADAFKAKNYVSWQFPVIIPAAQGAAESFFNNLDNGTTVGTALGELEAQRASIGGMGGISVGKTRLRSVTEDDTIIDLTPEPTTP